MERAIARYLLLQHLTPFRNEVETIRNTANLKEVMDFLVHNGVKELELPKDYEHLVHRQVVVEKKGDSWRATLDWQGVWAELGGAKWDSILTKSDYADYAKMAKSEAALSHVHDKDVDVLDGRLSKDVIEAIESHESAMREIPAKRIASLWSAGTLKEVFIADLTRAMGRVIDEFFPLEEYGLPSIQLLGILINFILNKAMVASSVRQAAEGQAERLTVKDRYSISGKIAGQTYAFFIHSSVSSTADVYGLMKDREILFLEQLIGEIAPKEFCWDTYRQDFDERQRHLKKVLALQPRHQVVFYPGVPPTSMRRSDVGNNIFAVLERADVRIDLATVSKHCSLYADRRFNRRMTYADIANEINRGRMDTEKGGALYQEDVSRQIRDLAELTGFTQENEAITEESRRRKK